MTDLNRTNEVEPWTGVVGPEHEWPLVESEYDFRRYSFKVVAYSSTDKAHAMQVGMNFSSELLTYADSREILVHRIIDLAKRKYDQGQVDECYGYLSIAKHLRTL